MWQNIAYILIGLGILALIGWAVEGFFTSDEIPILIRIAVGVMGLGVIILIVVAIKDRINRSKDEDLKGVDK
jgi:Ca2+/Na+ antiporter